MPSSSSEGAQTCAGFDSWGSGDLCRDNHCLSFSRTVRVSGAPEVVIVVLVNRVQRAAGPRVQLGLKPKYRLGEDFGHEVRNDKVVPGVEQGAERDRLLAPRLSHQAHHSPPIKGKTCGKPKKE